MNNKAFYLWSALFLFVSCVIYGVVFATLYSSGAKKVNEVVDSLAKSEIRTILITIHNDLMTGNFSQAQINFARAMTGSSVVGIEVLQQGSRVLKYPDALPSAEDRYKVIKQTIRFSEDGEVWGEARFYVDQKRATEIKNEMAIGNMAIGVLLLIVLLVCVLSLLVFFRLVSEIC